MRRRRRSRSRRLSRVSSLTVYFRGVFNMKWDWQKLIVAIIAAIVGWFSNVVLPAPGTQAIAKVQSPVLQNIPR